MSIKKLTLSVMIFIILSITYIDGSFGLVSSQQSMPEVKPLLIVGDDMDYPPYSFLDDEGKPSGFNIELMEALSEVMGFQVEFRLGKWNEVMQQLKNGDVDLISGMFYSTEREIDFDFTIHHSIASGDVFTREDFSLDSIEDLAGLKVVVQTNDIIYEFLKNSNLDIEFIGVPTITEALSLVASGEYDYAAALKLTGHYIMDKQNFSNLKSNGLRLDPQNYSMAVQKGNTPLLIYLNEGLVVLNNTGRYQEIYDKWLGIYEEKDLWDIVKSYAWVVYTLVTLLILLLAWSFFLRKAVDTRTMELLKAKSILQENQEELTASNEELEASLEELVATEENLRVQFDLLKESESKYKTLLTQMHQGIALHEVILNESGEIVDYRFLDMNDGFERLTGLKRNEVLGKSIIEVIPQTADYWIDHYSKVSKTGESLFFERFSKDRSKYFEVAAYSPKTNQLAVILTDITERRKSEELLKLSEETFRKLFEYSSDSILLIENDIIFDCNAATVTLLGYASKQDIIGKNSSQLSPDKQFDGKSSIEKSNEIDQILEENGKARFEWLFSKKDGTLLPVDVMLTTIFLNEKEVTHALCRDITEQKIMEQKLEFLSYHDQLTGLYNRRYFEEELIRLDDPIHFPLSIIMADVNGLKLINDAFGHTIGDQLLQKVAKVLKEGCRSDDIIARLGGDEFVILLPRTNHSEAENTMKRIKNLTLSEKVNSIDLSISFGMDTHSKENISIQEVLKNAENDMYKKKLYESPSIRSKNISIIMNTLNEKSEREEAHSQRVSELCKAMGKALKLSDEKIEELKIVGLLHDIGKIAITDFVLNKSGSLTTEEWEEIKRHPEIGYRILSSVNDMSDISEYVLTHHESWDGSGYPKGLKEKEIPLVARIITIVDAYDAMTSERSYRSPISHEEAIQELLKCSGVQFDAELVKVFIEKVKIE